MLLSWASDSGVSAWNCSFFEIMKYTMFCLKAKLQRLNNNVLVEIISTIWKTNVYLKHEATVNIIFRFIQIVMSKLVDTG